MGRRRDDASSGPAKIEDGLPQFTFCDESLSPTLSTDLVVIWTAVMFIALAYDINDAVSNHCG